ncbi:MAG: hypothetical protein LBI10_12740 [Deltaproteobacteria bacterium]|jgi:hypothetical protein|nr:hypothetical protein [Deltaproteobacteria bacterium]
MEDNNKKVPESPFVDEVTKLSPQNKLIDWHKAFPACFQSYFYTITDSLLVNIENTYNLKKT